MKKYLIVLSLVGLVTTSCYEKLNITPPNNITNEQVMKLLETANSETVVTIMGALADALPQAVKSGGYATFNNYYSAYDYQGQDMVRGSTGNDIVVGNTTPSGDLGNLYEGLSIRSSASNVNQPYWQRGYAMVHAANKVFNMLTDELVEKNGTAVLKEYQGRAFLLRAYAYLYLMENYANPYKPGTEQLGVPVYTKYDVGQPLQARASSAEVYDSIVAWTNKAISLFEKSGSVGYARNKSGAMNLGVANFILARAALCKQDWTTVISACDKLIANYSLMSENQYVARNEPGTTGEKYVYYADNSGFSSLDANPECILGWENDQKAYGTVAAWMNFMRGAIITRIDDRLYNKMDDNDFRKANFQNDKPFGTFYTAGNGSFTDGSSFEVANYINFKFAANVGRGAQVGNSSVSNPGKLDYCMFRVAEAYLMKAEAYAQQGKDNEAKSVLNLLLSARTKAGATPLTCNTYKDMSGKSALEMVQLQTRIEMWGERGLEWYNNRRWNIPVNRAGSSDHHNTSMTYSVADMTIQIPDQEINTNNLIVQNP